MKPCSELNRRVRPTLEWVLLGGGAWVEGAEVRLIWGFGAAAGRGNAGKGVELALRDGNRAVGAE
jgi:hypothetical protein